VTKSDEANFGGSATAWWSIAAQWLGWRPQEFWQATPTELRGALSDPKSAADGRGPSMETIAEMLERENNG